MQHAFGFISFSFKPFSFRPSPSRLVSRLPALPLVLLAGSLLALLPACRAAPDASPRRPHIDSSKTQALTLMEIVGRRGDVQMTARALRATGLAETLEQTGPHTLFALTDAAFRMSAPAFDSLLTARPDSIRALFAHFIVRGRLRPAAGTGTLRVGTLAAQPLTLRRRSGALCIRTACAAAMVGAQNGLLYLFDEPFFAPHVPPSEQLR